jgi:oligosaccharyltransferase complex subunit alpha (ribophorin I)
LYVSQVLCFYSAKVFEVTLDSPLASGETVKVTIDMVFSHALRAFPEKIAQAEKQNVVLEGNHYFFSPYKTGKQSTTVKLTSSTVESYSKLKPTSQEEETVNYGPYENIAPLQKSNMKIHYENNSPFLTVSMCAVWRTWYIVILTSRDEHMFEMPKKSKCLKKADCR